MDILKKTNEPNLFGFMNVKTDPDRVSSHNNNKKKDDPTHPNPVALPTIVCLSKTPNTPMV